MKKILISLVLCFILLPVIVNAQDYYVDTNSIGGTCSDSNSGTITEPWCTITKANAFLQAGDTVYIRAGTYTDNDQNSIINPDNSGSSENYITYMPYNNEEVICNGRWAGAKLYDVSYIKIDGIKFSQSDQTGPMYVGVDLRNADYCIIQNCLVKNMKFPGSWQGIKFNVDCSYCQILNNTVDYVGNYWTLEYDNPGDCIWIEGDHHIVTGNMLDHCGHSGIYLRCDKSVIKNNTMHGSWCRGMDIGIRPEWTTHRNVIENNIIYEIRQYRQGRPQKGVQHTSGHNTIFRRNLIWDSWGNAMQIYGGPDEATRKIRVYHNTAYMIGTEQVTDWEHALNVVENTDGTITECDYRNNIFYNNSKDGVHYYIYADPEDHYLTNNHWDADGDPKFADEANRDFRLQSNSPCIDNGAWLTITTSSGSGIQIPVNDANYFTDGWGIVDGDVIQLEDQTQTARIINVDYNNNILTVDTSLNWNSGQGVSLVYNGEAPDIGAYEYDSGSPPSNCTGTCKINTCGSYDDCSSASGTCVSGYCCLGTCMTPSCSDGTPYGQCSSNQPQYCDNGNLVDDCSTCGCPGGYDCQANGSCQPSGNISTGPVALYPFDEGSDSIAYDSSGYGNDGTINGATWTNNSFSGYALEFNGVGDYVNVNENDTLDPSEITISAWIKIPSAPTSPGNVVSKGGNLGYRIWIANNRKVGWFDRGGTNQIFTTDLVPISEWTHITVVGSSSGLRIYINGELNASNAVPYGGPDTTYNLEIGASTPNNEYFNGTIDEVRIYNRALTPEEILALYNGTNGTKPLITGDLNDDGVIDIFDLVVIGVNFGLTSGFNVIADTDNNSIIDVSDLVFVASRFT